MTGTTIAQAIPIAISPILTRLYSPEDFGVFALYMSVASIFSVIVTGRYESAIMLPKKESDAINLVVLSIIITCCISFIVFIIICNFNIEITNMLGNQELSNWLYFVPLTIFLTGLYQSFNNWNNRKRQYHKISVSRVVQSSSSATTNIGIGYGGFGSGGLILSSIVGQIFGTLYLVKKSFDRQDFLSVHLNKIKIIALAKKYKNFPLFNTQHALINIVFSQMPILFISKFFDSAILGFYSLSLRVVQTPISVLGNAMGVVLYEKIAKLRNTNQKYMKQVYRFLKVQIIFATILFSGVFILSNYMDQIFGSNWAEVGFYIKLLIPWLFMVFIISPLAFSINLTNNQKQGLSLEWIYGSIKLGSLLIGALYFKKIEITLILFSVANALFLLYQGTWFINILKKEEK